MNQLESSYIVDDDPIHQFGMKMLMRKLGFSKEVMVFNNGQEAIEALWDLVQAKLPFPNVIFLDLNMPIKDGWGFRSFNICQSIPTCRLLDNIAAFIISLVQNFYIAWDGSSPSTIIFRLG